MFLKTIFWMIVFAMKRDSKCRYRNNDRDLLSPTTRNYLFFCSSKQMLSHFFVVSVNIISEIQFSIAVYPGSEVTNKDRYSLFQCYIFFFTAIHGPCDTGFIPGGLIAQ